MRSTAYERHSDAQVKGTEHFMVRDLARSTYRAKDRRWSVQRKVNAGINGVRKNTIKILSYSSSSNVRESRDELERKQILEGAVVAAVRLKNGVEEGCACHILFCQSRITIEKVANQGVAVRVRTGR